MIEEKSEILKNTNGFLPIHLKKVKRIAVMGTLAKRLKIEEKSVFDFLKNNLGNQVELDYAAGHLDTSEVNETVMNEAQRAAFIADLVLIFVGFLNTEKGSVAVKLPTPQNVLVDVVSQVEKNVIVVVKANLEIKMPWKKQVKGILSLEAINKEVMNCLFEQR